MATGMYSRELETEAPFYGNHSPLMISCFQPWKIFPTGNERFDWMKMKINSFSEQRDAYYVFG